MKNISIDIETYSSVDLLKCGVYKYAESPDFEILLFAYSVDGGEVDVVDIANGEKIPEPILKALSDESITKWAFNANFERVCLSFYLNDVFLTPRSWHCSSVWASTLGLPRSLEKVGEVLGLEKQKLKEGKNLIRYFCVPCKPTKVNGERTRNSPRHDREKWEIFKAYNKRDVETEMAIQDSLSPFPVSDEIWEEYYLDQEINDRGIKVDMTLVKNAILFDEQTRENLLKKMTDKTGLENPNSVTQLKAWLENKGIKVTSLDKKAVPELINNSSDEIKEVLTLRQGISKSSIKKYSAIENAVCKDDRLRGMFQFYGAARSGRFAGRIVQLQNLRRNSMSDLEQARGLIKNGDYEAMELLYADIPDTLSQLIRTAFIPKKNKKFIVADFSAIEARVLAWLAGEKWRMEVFEKGGDIYCSSAAKMFKVPVKKHGVNGHLRGKGKIAELALGYGGSVGALKAMGALEMGLNEKELQPLVTSWREANPNITSLWWKIDKAVKACIKLGRLVKVQAITIMCIQGVLFIELPSGRKLSYIKPKIGVNKFGSESVTYEGVGVNKKWERIESYGPKFVENIIQGIARDLLVYAMQNLKAFNIVAHIHDEVILEVDKDISVEEVCKIMSRTPSWAKGLKLDADGYECAFYKKD